MRVLLPTFNPPEKWELSGSCICILRRHEYAHKWNDRTDHKSVAAFLRQDRRVPVLDRHRRGLFAEIFVRGRLVVHGDAAATAHNIMTHELLYRLGLAAEVFYLACNVPLTIIFYGLFKVVNKNVVCLRHLRPCVNRH